MNYFGGIDVGAISTEAVIIDTGGGISGYSIAETGANSTEAADEAFGKALLAAGIGRVAVSCIAATGYGRVSVPLANKTGTVIDIGGQDSKVIRIGDSGKVLDFTMNDKCAAGTGRFLEVMASKLRVSLEEMGELSLHAKAEAHISSVCTVFAESEVVSLVAKNHPKEEIIKGLHRAITNRVWSMVNAIGVYGEVTMSGGVAKNKGVVTLMEEKLGKPIRVYVEPQIVGALGAALFAQRQLRGTSGQGAEKGKSSRFA
jgi:activator of 2-hydroxyglutaryl-CoA dehydratase